TPISSARWPTRFPASRRTCAPASSSSMCEPMPRVRRVFRLAASAATLWLSCGLAQAQDLDRFTADSVIAVHMFGGENVSNRPQIVVDVSAAMRVGDHWQLLIRPWFRKARPSTPGGAVPDWDAQLYQAGARYERTGPLAVRVDLGQIVSPVGL